MRNATLAFVIALIASLPAAAGRTVFLDAPGALDAIEKENPAHYRKITEIVRIAGDVSCETLPGMLKVQFNASDTRCFGALILTSYPPKRHLSFTLDDSRYVTNVILRNYAARVMPAQ